MSIIRRRLLKNQKSKVVYDAILTKSGGSLTASNRAVNFGNANERHFAPEIGKTYLIEGYVDVEITSGDDSTMRCTPMSSQGFGYKVLCYATRFEQISPTVRRYTVMVNPEQQPVQANMQFLFYLRCDYCTVNVTTHITITEV